MGAGISQSKWLWYRQEEPRTLQDLQIFDDASRGPWGAVQLLISLRARCVGGIRLERAKEIADTVCRHLAFLGAVLIILSNLFDPFLQQVVSYPDRLVPSSDIPTVARTQIYESHSSEGLPLPGIVDLNMKAAIYNGIFGIQGKAALGISHTCGTGNCSWDAFSSLVVCSKCVDISSYIQKHCKGDDCWRLSLPNGPSLSGLGRQINSSVTNISSSLASIEASVVKFSSLKSPSPNESTDATALECAIWYCVQKRTASATSGVIHEKVLSSWRNDSAQLSDSSDLYYMPPESITNSTTSPTTFRVTHLAAKALNSFMSETFTGSGGTNSSSGSSAYTSDVMQALHNAPNITVRIDNLSVSMSNNIREQENVISNHANGTAFKTETYVQVRWAWFAFPAAIVALSLLFLLGAIIETAHRDVLVWKSNNLALLFHGRELDLGRDSERVVVNKLSQMMARAAEIKVELVREAEDWRLVQR